MTRRPADFKTYDELQADVKRLRQGCDCIGKWSLEQCVDHLNKSMIAAMDETKGMPRPARFIFRFALWRMLRTRSMPRMPAPKFLTPVVDVDEKVFEEFDSIVRRCKSLPGPTIDHPAFGRIALDDWHQLQLLHASRHLSFQLPKNPA